MSRSVHRHIRRIVARLQVLLFDDLQPHHPFEHGQNGVRVDHARRDLLIAALPRLQAQIEGRNRAPEILIAKRFEPFAYLLLVVEISHANSVPDCGPVPQICGAKRGLPWR